MPTHFSKLEGSPSNMQRERRRRRKLVSGQPSPAAFFDESVSSRVTACEGNYYSNKGNILQRDAGDIPIFINVEDSRRLQLTSRQGNEPRRNQRLETDTQQYRKRNVRTFQRLHERTLDHRNGRTNHQASRPPQYDAYCETRVSAISSFHDRAASSRVSSLSSSHRSDDPSRNSTNRNSDRYAVPPRRGPAPHARRRDLSRASRAAPSADRKSYRDRPAPRFMNDPSLLSDPRSHTDQTRSSGDRPRVHMLVNEHGIYGGSSKQQTLEKNKDAKDSISSSSSRRRRAKNALQSVRNLEQSITDAYGDPYDNDRYSSGRRNQVIDDGDESFESRNQATLRGEKFADAGSDDEHPIVALSHAPQHSSRITGDVCPVAADANPQFPAKRWLCDVCKEARFESYVDAYRHEIECRRRKGLSNTQAPKKLDPRGERAALESRNDSIHQNNQGQFLGREDILNEMHGMTLSSRDGNKSVRQINEGHLLGTGNIRNPMQEMTLSSSDSRSDHCSIIAAPGLGTSESVASMAATRWLCSVCKEVSFDNYPDACHHEKICRIRMEATADLRAAGRKLVKIDLPPVCTQARDDSNWHSRSAVMTPEHRQEDDAREGNNSEDPYHGMDAIERERLNDSLIIKTSNEKMLKDPTIVGFHNEKTVPVEARDDQSYAFNANANDGLPRDLFSTRGKKGEAYDRYVLLASQQEDEEERERLIALAKQTREEEFLIYRRGDNESEGYVCLA